MPAMIVLTSAGIDALVDAQNAVTAPIEITEVGLADASFIAAPTLTALPNEFKRIDTVSGVAVSENVLHMVARDASADVYDAYGFGLYLADGTLFGTYSQVDPIVNKVSIAQFLISIDIAFATAVDAAIVFGDADFLNPPATETVAGVAMLATNALADAGVDHTTIMTPAKVKRVLDAFTTAMNAAWAAFQTAVNASIAALQGRTITGAGLATGGGDLSANRVITVTAASAAELQAATEAGKAVTPASFGGLPRSHGTTGYEVLPGGLLMQRGQYRSTISGQTTISITFPVAFADTNYDLQLTPVIPSAGDFDNLVQEVNGTRSTTGVSIYTQDPSSGGSGDLAGFNWRAEGRA